jgi:hypothetical protein
MRRGKKSDPRRATRALRFSATGCQGKRRTTNGHEVTPFRFRRLVSAPSAKKSINIGAFCKIRTCTGRSRALPGGHPPRHKPETWFTSCLGFGQGAGFSAQVSLPPLRGSRRDKGACPQSIRWGIIPFPISLPGRKEGNGRFPANSGVGPPPHQPSPFGSSMYRIYGMIVLNRLAPPQATFSPQPRTPRPRSTTLAATC